MTTPGAKDRLHVVLTTDFSDESLRAFAPAAELARRLPARITLLHVVTDFRMIPYGAMMAPPLSDPRLPEHVAAARKTIQELRARLPADADVQTEVATAERVEKGICAYAEERGADYIVMATHGRTALHRLVMGSVAELVLRHAVTPVVVIPRTG